MSEKSLPVLFLRDRSTTPEPISLNRKSSGSRSTSTNTTQGTSWDFQNRVEIPPRRHFPASSLDLPIRKGILQMLFHDHSPMF